MSVSIAAQTTGALSDILEQAAYQQDTANNPERAIALYRQVIESEKATRQMMAQALYNTGLCYAKLKRSTEADQAFGAVVSQYKNLAPYYGLANARLNASFTPTAPGWQDGERLEYEVHVKNIDGVVDFYWTTTTKVDWNGRAAWKMLNRAQANNGLSMTIADEKTLRPMFSRAINPFIGHATATWTDKAIAVTKADQELTQETRFEGVVYDAEQGSWLLRQIPLSVGTKIRASLLSTILSEKTLPLEIEVIGEETIQVPAGQFNAYKLVDAAGISTYWIDKGPERHLLKTADAVSTMELKRVSRVTPNAWRTVASGASKFGISIPDEWFDASKQGESKYPAVQTIGGKNARSVVTIPREEFYILGDDASITIRVYVSEMKALQDYGSFDPSLAGRVATGTQQLQRNLKKYVERAGSRIDRLIANLPAVSVIADHEGRGEDWVNYSTYVMRDSKSLWIAFSTPKKNFDEAKPTFDRILSTVTF